MVEAEREREREREIEVTYAIKASWVVFRSRCITCLRTRL